MFLGIEIGGTKLQFGVGPAECGKLTALQRADGSSRPTAPRASAGKSNEIAAPLARPVWRPGHRLRFWRAGRSPGRPDREEPSRRGLGRFPAGRLVPRRRLACRPPWATIPTWPGWAKPGSEPAAAAASSSIPTSAAASAGRWSSTGGCMPAAGHLFRTGTSSPGPAGRDARADRRTGGQRLGDCRRGPRRCPLGRRIATAAPLPRRAVDQQDGGRSGRCRQRRRPWTSSAGRRKPTAGPLRR